MDLLVVGLHKGDSGRSCASHDVCGEHVQVGDLLHFEPFNLGTEYRVLKESCHVGYLKWDVAQAHPAHHFRNRLAEVMELFYESEESDVRHYSYANYGIARIELYPSSFCKHIK